MTSSLASPVGRYRGCGPQSRLNIEPSPWIVLICSLNALGSQVIIIDLKWATSPVQRRTSSDDQLQEGVRTFHGCFLANKKTTTDDPFLSCMGQTIGQNSKLRLRSVASNPPSDNPEPWFLLSCSHFSSTSSLSVSTKSSLEAFPTNLGLNLLCDL